MLVVNLDFGIDIKNFPIFAGEYKEFSIDWYRTIGSTLVINIFNIIKCIDFNNDRKYNNSSYFKWVIFIFGELQKML